MLSFTDPNQMQQQALAWRQTSETIAFVPTMGALHRGHAALLQAGRSRGTKLVLSIFVNPAQFGPNEDLSNYPRSLEADLELAQQCEVDAVFLPTQEAIYPANFRSYVEVEQLTRGLCGGARPEHFRGVTTIILKLLQIVQPHCTLFGEKDYQQLQVIRRMVTDFMIPVEIIGVPTVREADGLALSSRNQHLSAAERQTARAIPEALFAAQEMKAQGPDEMITAVRATLIAAGLRDIDYITIVNPNTLVPVTRLDQPARLCVAVRIGETRLIDNVGL